MTAHQIGVVFNPTGGPFTLITSFMRGKRAIDWTDAYAILKAGHSSLLQPSMITPATMDAAAEDGRLDIVQYLHAHHNGVGCTTDAIDFAAGEGHLEVVKFLRQNRSEGCTEQAMNFAAAGGFLDVVEYLYHCTSTYDISHALLYASDFRQKQVVEWLECQPCRRHPLLDSCSMYTHVDVVVAPPRRKTLLGKVKAMLDWNIAPDLAL
ncbi:hypothetical protein DYB30_004738 [Aphanomyces astaci]|nr:hypothetical protein DYB38_004232 [Aphanomyces astaci]RHY67468.1 hypothetical protein DYB30_004738 [Aphanomyces astaci]RHZ13997.1 hypothetical protein DYB31_005136 [Aphanomyces astaci]